MKLPLLIYDGDCPFCTRWALRLGRLNPGRLRIAPYQSAAAQFPAVPAGQWATAVALALADGRLFWGAEAVLQALALRRGWGWLPAAYAWLPGARWLGDRTYQFVARARTRTGCAACGH